MEEGRLPEPVVVTSEERDGNDCGSLAEYIVRLKVTGLMESEVSTRQCKLVNQLGCQLRHHASWNQSCRNEQMRILLRDKLHVF